MTSTHPLAGHTIVLHGAYGRLCNRTIQLAHMMALAREVGCTVAYPALADYADIFAAPSPLFLYPDNAAVGPRITEAMARLEQRLATGEGDIDGFGYWYFDDARAVDLLGAEFVGAVAQRRLAFVRGWGLRVADAVLDRHAPAIRQALALRPDAVATGAKLVADLRGGHPDCRVIGVHVRQTDLRTWQDGRYFYPPEAWRAMMDGLAVRAAARGLSLAWYVATDDPGCMDPLPDQAIAGGRDVAEDLATLAACDLVLCPPTTFGPWAAFLGGRPVVRIPDMTAFFDTQAEEVLGLLA